jgi:hypothetical protein
MLGEVDGLGVVTGSACYEETVTRMGGGERPRLPALWTTVPGSTTNARGAPTVATQWHVFSFMTKARTSGYVRVQQNRFRWNGVGTRPKRVRDAQCPRNHTS